LVYVLIWLHWYVDSVTYYTAVKVNESYVYQHGYERDSNFYNNIYKALFI
jgi:hypothetical protein